MGNRICFGAVGLLTELIYTVFKKWNQRRTEGGEEFLVSNMQRYDHWENSIDNRKDEYDEWLTLFRQSEIHR